MNKLKEKLLNAPYLSEEDNMLFDYLYIIQDRKKHESGYNMMHIVGCNVNGETMKYYKLSDISDVIDIDEINFNSQTKISFDIPEYNVLRLFLHTTDRKFKVSYLHCSTFKIDLVEKG